MNQPPQRDSSMYILLGCAGLLMLSLCLASGLGAWMFYSRVAGPTATPVIAPPTPAPIGGPQMPAPPIQPGQQGPALPPPPPAAGPPLMIAGSVTHVAGRSPVPVGAACNFSVERLPRDPSTYWCRTQVFCGGVSLYGGGSAGYFNCTFSPTQVAGQDLDTSAADTDAAFTINSEAGVFEIRDDASGAHGAFVLNASITSVR